jgi:hypothetical protein
MRAQSLLIAAMCGAVAMAGTIKYQGSSRPSLCLALDEESSPISEIVLDRCDGSAEQQWLDNTENYQIQSASIRNRCLHAGSAKNVTAPRFPGRNWNSTSTRQEPSTLVTRGLIAAACELAQPASNVVKPQPIDEQKFELLDDGSIRWRGGLKAIAANTTTYCVEASAARFASSVSIKPCVPGKLTQSFEFVPAPYDE